MDVPNRPRPAVLMILDGFGVAPDSDGNAITRANMPRWKQLIKTYPTMTIRASGEEVGLSWGEMGNSEVGHLTLGAGRIVDSDLVRINRAIRDKSFFRNKALLEALHHCKKNRRKLHLMGLLSDAGVHSHINHLFALLELAKKNGIKEDYFCCIYFLVSPVF